MSLRLDVWNLYFVHREHPVASYEHIGTFLSGDVVRSAAQRHDGTDWPTWPLVYFGLRGEEPTERLYVCEGVYLQESFER